MILDHTKPQLDLWLARRTHWDAIRLAAQKKAMKKHSDGKSTSDPAALQAVDTSPRAMLRGRREAMGFFGPKA